MYGDGALLDAAPCEFEQNDSDDVAFGLPCDDTADQFCGTISECRAWSSSRTPRAVSARCGRGACRAGDEPTS